MYRRYPSPTQAARAVGVHRAKITDYSYGLKVEASDLGWRYARSFRHERLKFEEKEEEDGG